jgi:hypothetical protein
MFSQLLPAPLLAIAKSALVAVSLAQPICWLVCAVCLRLVACSVSQAASCALTVSRIPQQQRLSDPLVGFSVCFMAVLSAAQLLCPT